MEQRLYHKRYFEKIELASHKARKDCMEFEGV
jgi:hypothetical protein